ncbi:MAG: hypothetical protein JNN15_17010 [Blastocatellia bacterium]|nr:hypothetical protein [Blastocatellia bacterium]
MGSSENSKWLFSANIDISLFLGSFLLSLLAIVLGARFYQDTPEWLWVGAILFVDVAHVYSTAFRVYFDKEELKERAWLYLSVPLLAYIVGLALYSESEMLFWRVLAYLAVFHFVRQQYGWIALYRAKQKEQSKVGYWIDTCTIYAATIYPLVYWHTHLPRKFAWFLQGDFSPLPLLVDQFLRPLYWLLLLTYLIRSIYKWFVGEGNPGKDIVTITTAFCWYVGIVYLDSDYTFTATNIFIHGIPYLGLIYFYSCKRAERDDRVGQYYRKFFSVGPIAFLIVLWFFAYVEEMWWDKIVWQEREWLFGKPLEASFSLPLLKFWLIPLLALPQACHYILDGFIWKRRHRLFLFLF